MERENNSVRENVTCELVNLPLLYSMYLYSLQRACVVLVSTTLWSLFGGKIGLSIMVFIH